MTQQPNYLHASEALSSLNTHSPARPGTQPAETKSVVSGGKSITWPGQVPPRFGLPCVLLRTTGLRTHAYPTSLGLGTRTANSRRGL